MRIYSKSALAVLLGLSSLGVAGPVAAQWRVIDDTQIKANDQNTQTVTGNADSNRKIIDDTLKTIYESQRIGPAASEEKPSGEEVEDPKEALAKVDDDYGVSSCGSQTSGTPVSAKQKSTCELIQRTRNSQYNYMVAMHEITKKRLERLRAIEQERKEIQETQIGRLEDNTNKLVALKTLMDIDRQQMESAMFAYETRLNYLMKQQTNQSKSAMNGKDIDESGSGGLFGGSTGDVLKSFAGKVAAGAVMKGVLDELKSESKSKQQMRRLSID